MSAEHTPSAPPQSPFVHELKYLYLQSAELGAVGPTAAGVTCPLLPGRPVAWRRHCANRTVRHKCHKRCICNLSFTGGIGVIAREREPQRRVCRGGREGAVYEQTWEGGKAGPWSWLRGVGVTSADTAQRLVPEPAEYPLHPEGERVWGTSILQGSSVTCQTRI